MSRERRLFPLDESEDELHRRADASLTVGSLLQELVTEQDTVTALNHTLLSFGLRVAQNSHNVGGLLHAYSGTIHYQNLKERIGAIRDDRNDRLTYDSFGEIKGKVFAYAAYAALSAQAKVNGAVTVLSEERTLRLYRRIYNMPIALHDFSNSILGITVPDGLVISSANGRPQIEAILEYTTRTKQPDYFKKKFESHSTRLHKFRSRGSQTAAIFAPQPTLLFVTTHFEEEAEKQAVLDQFPNGEILTPHVHELLPWSFPFIVADNNTRQWENAIGG